MISLHSLKGLNIAAGNLAHERNHGERIFCQIDLAPEKCDTRAIFFGLVQKFETVTCCASPTAEYAHRNARVKGRQLFQCFRAVVGDFQKLRPVSFGNTSKTAHNAVINIMGNLRWIDPAIDVGIEHFQKIFEIMARRIFAECAEMLQRCVVIGEIIVEGNRVEPEISSRQHARKRSSAEGAARLLGIISAAHHPDIRRVIGANGRLDSAVFENALLDQRFQIGGRKQHDINDILFDDSADIFQKLRPRDKACGGAILVPFWPAAGNARPHIAILRIGNNEITALILARADTGEFLIKSVHF